MENMVKGIEKSPKIFSCAAKMVQFNNRELIDSAGDYYTIIGCTFTKGYNKKTQYFNKDGIIFSSCAGAAIYRRKVFDEIGLFDTMHFAYLEDIDVGYRGRIAGYKNVYCPKAKVYHIGSATSGSKYNEFKVKLSARNNIYLIYKNTPFLQEVVNFPFIAAGFAVKAVFFRKMGFGKAYMDGIKEGIRTMHKCKKVPYKSDNLANYIEIEKELIVNTYIYARDYLTRRGF